MTLRACALRWCVLLAALAVAAPQLLATTYTVAGTPAALLTTEWSVTQTSNDMSQYGSTTNYYLIKSGTLSTGTTYYFKVALDHAWTTSYPSDNYGYTVPSNGTYTVVYRFNTNGNSVSLTGPFSSLTVAGSDTQALGSSTWNATVTDNDMTSSDGITYTLTKSGVTYSAAGSYECKVVANHTWDNSASYPSSNKSYTINEAGTYDVTYSFNVITQEVSITATKSSSEETETYDYTFYVRSDNVTPYLYSWTGDTKLLGDWPGTLASTTETINGYTYYKFTCSSTSKTVSVIVNNNNGTQTNDLTTTEGTYTYYITFDTNSPSSSTLNTEPDEAEETHTYTYNIYVRYTGSGTAYLWAWDDDQNYTGGTWPGTKLTDLTTETINGYTYYKLTVESTYSTLDVILNEGSGNGQTEDISINGVADDSVDCYFTYEGGSTYTIGDEPDEEETTYTYTFYVRTTDGTVPYLYGWNTSNDSEKPFGSWAGTQGSTTETINGYTYYKFTCTTSAAQLGVIVTNNNGSNQTGDLTTTKGVYTYYITYSTSTASDVKIHTSPDVQVKTGMFLIGNSSDWAADEGTEMTDNGDGTYTLTNVLLQANYEFAFSTKLGCNSEDWTTMNSGRLASTGTSHWAVKDEYLMGTAMSYTTYDSNDDNHNWYVTANGYYNITVDTNNGTVTITSVYDLLYIGYGVDWSWDNALQMGTTDGKTYQATVTFANGDYFQFSTDKTSNVESLYGATENGYEINDIRLNVYQDLVAQTTNNFKFTAPTGVYIVIAVPSEGKVKVMRTAYGDTKTPTKIYLQQTSNVTLNPTGGTFQNKTVSGARGGIYAWNTLNLAECNGTTYSKSDNGPTNYTYSGEVGTNFNGNAAGDDGVNYKGDGYLKDLNDTITADGKKWWAWSVSNAICEFYFIRSNQTDLKSQMIMRRAGEVWLTWIDENAKANRQTGAEENDSLQDVTRTYYAVSANGVADCCQMLEGHYYVYYTNTTGWPSVYCYAWNDDGSVTSSWPGNLCTFVGYDDDGYEVWLYDFGLISELGDNVPTGIIFNNGKGVSDDLKQQTGDLPFSNGGCYDYLGLIYLGHSLGNIINHGIVKGPKYTVEDDLVGVYYDKNAVTKIEAYNEETGNTDTYYSIGALYAKDLDLYSGKSKQPAGTTDYVYDICAHEVSDTYPGGSQIQPYRTEYDQSNWVKIVLSPNFTNVREMLNVEVDTSKIGDSFVYDQVNGIESNSANFNGKTYLERFVGHIIPAKSMSGNLMNNVNPEMHITNIGRVGDAYDYEKNVYITGHFNDTIIYTYTHNEWNPGTYKGCYRTEPIMRDSLNANGDTVYYKGVPIKVVDSVRIVDGELYKMFYVAPKPQEVAYITWAVYDNLELKESNSQQYSLMGTNELQEEPKYPGAFYGPMNWNRTGFLWDGSNVANLSDTTYAWGTTYGPYSNGYAQYGAFKVNWSLYEGMGANNWYDETGSDKLPWYKVFKPGQAYKIVAIIRYAFDDAYNGDNTVYEYEPGVYGADDTSENPDVSSNSDHVFNAPRRSNTTWLDMQHVPYDGLATSKLIVFPILGSSDDTNGADIGNVTVVEEVKVTPTSKDIVSVRYYNLMGMESSKPFEGLNIIVTTYSDGSRTSQKVLR